MDDDKLIEQVRLYEELYNMAHNKYSDNLPKDKIWDNVGKELNTTGPICKARWVCLRDQLRRALKRKSTKSGQSADSKKKWKYEDCMSFLIPFFNERDTLSNIESLGEDLNSSEATSPNIHNNMSKQMGEEEDELAETCTEKEEPLPETCNSSPRKKKFPKMSAPSSSRSINIKKKESAASVLMSYLLENQETQATNKSSAHPLDIFFDGIAATVKTFSPELQHMAKSRIFSIVSDLEWENLNKKTSNCPRVLSSTPPTISIPSSYNVQFDRPQGNPLPILQQSYSNGSTPSPHSVASTQSYYENFNPEV